MRFHSQFLATVAMFGLLLGFVPALPVHAGGNAAEPGDLIRGTSFSAVYYMGEDGFRYVFPSDKTYFTWYENFDDVITLSDADLATIQMGGNVTYRPGSKMIKINSDPKTYAIANGGTLRWVTSEAIAVELYGADWNTKIDDVADGFFTNYEIGDAIEEGDMYDPAAELDGTTTISQDKDLSAYSTVSIENMEFTRLDVADTSTLTISAGQTVMWTNNDSMNHTATADDNSWGTGTIKPGGSFVRRFDEPGTYTYFCSYHPEMMGTIIVEEALTM